jgi:hypothetical protein
MATVLLLYARLMQHSTLYTALNGLITLTSFEQTKRLGSSRASVVIEEKADIVTDSHGFHLYRAENQFLLCDHRRIRSLSHFCTTKTQLRARWPWYETVSKLPTKQVFAGGRGALASPSGEPGRCLPTSNL